jgi:hypothetical protein
MEIVMHKLARRAFFAFGLAAMICAAPLSIEWSPQTGIALSLNNAHARIGRPLTPGSVAGVARRTTRRTVRRHAVYGHHHCVYVWVNGVHVCR